jgi:molybdopterin converting factor subunit 1
MIVRVLLFARYREAAGKEAVEVDLPPGATLGDLWEFLRRDIAGLKVEAQPLMSIDRAYATPAAILEEGREVAFFPPVSGG